MNNIGAYQSARMRRLISAFVVRKLPNTGFLASRPICAEGLDSIPPVIPHLEPVCFLAPVSLCVGHTAQKCSTHV